jgi:hypothetical protein
MSVTGALSAASLSVTGALSAAGLSISGTLTTNNIVPSAAYPTVASHIGTGPLPFYSLVVQTLYMSGTGFTVDMSSLNGISMTASLIRLLSSDLRLSTTLPPHAKGSPYMPLLININTGNVYVADTTW